MSINNQKSGISGVKHLMLDQKSQKKPRLTAAIFRVLLEKVYLFLKHAKHYCPKDS
jgi:hypothetical protein